MFTNCSSKGEMMRKTLRPPAAVAALVTVVVIGAGCGNGSGDNGSAGGNTTAATHNSTITAREKAVKLTECMRANGVTDFPDPNASGGFPSYGVSVSPAVWVRAVHACKSVEPPGSFSSKRTPAQQSAALRFAECVRAHGVKDFPDPVVGQPLIDTTRIPSSNRPGGMTILNAATHTCGHVLGAAGAQG